MESQRFGKLYLQALFCEYNIKRGDVQKLYDQFECSLEMIEESWENVKVENSTSLFENLLVVMKGFLLVNRNHHIGKEKIEVIVREIMEKQLDSNSFLSNYFQVNLNLKNHCNTNLAAKERNVLFLCMEILLIHCHNRDVDNLLWCLKSIICDCFSRFQTVMNKSLGIVVVLREMFQILVQDVFMLGKSSDNTLDFQTLNKKLIETNISIIVNFEFEFNCSEFEMIEEEEPQKEKMRLIDCISTILEESKEYSHKLQCIQVLSLIGMLSENYSFKMVPLLEKTIMYESDENLRFASITALWELMTIHPSLQNYNMMLSTGFGQNFEESVDPIDIILFDFVLSISAINQFTKRSATFSAVRMIRKQKCVDISVEHKLFSYIKGMSENEQDAHISKFLSKFTFDSAQKQIIVTPKTKKRTKK